MKYVVTLRCAEQGAIDRIGRRAMDLVLLNEKTIQVPLCFIITRDALTEFLRINSADKDISSAPFPTDMEEEFLEAYETLAISDELTSANHLMASAEAVDVLIIPSPAQNGNGPVRSLKGAKDFLDKVKEAWERMEEPGALIIEKMVKEELSGVVTIGQDDKLVVRAYYGLHLFSEIPVHDEFEVSKALLSIQNTRVLHQDSKLMRGDDDIEVVPLHERGSHQKATDKEVVEMARVAKRTQSYLKRDLELYFGLKKQRLYLLYCDDQPKEKAAEEAKAPEIEISVGDMKGVFEEEISEDQHAEERDDIPDEKKESIVVADDSIEGEGVEDPVSLGVDDSFIFDKGALDQEEVVTTKTEDAPVSYVNDLEQPFTEKSEEEFILTIPGRELMTESVRDPVSLMDHSRAEMAKLLGHVEQAIRRVLEAQLDKENLPVVEGISLSAMASELHERRRLPYYAEILRLDELLNKGNFSMENILFAFDTAERFVREHQ